MKNFVCPQWAVFLHCFGFLIVSFINYARSQFVNMSLTFVDENEYKMIACGRYARSSTSHVWYSGDFFRSRKRPLEVAPHHCRKSSSTTVQLGTYHSQTGNIQ